MVFEAIISAENLTKRFGSFTAVNSISFEVGRGEIFGFLGANGAGKTTAMKMLTGLLKPTSGSAMVAGFKVGSQNENIKANIGYMSQKFSLYTDLSVLDNIEFFGGVYGLRRSEIRRKAAELLERLGMNDYRSTAVHSLPLGWKQKLSLSVALLHNPKIVFLDEPTGGVDPITRRAFWDMIKEATDVGVTAFVTTHYMDEAEYCNRVSIMVDGNIAALGTPAQLKQQFTASSMDDVFVALARTAQRSSE